MAIDLSQFLATFYEESFEGLDVMEKELLNLDIGSADSETINTIFRAAHSIKGGSGTFGLTAVAGYTHVMETLLDEMRGGKRSVTQEAVNVLLRSVDVLREMLTALRDNRPLDSDSVAESQAQLNHLLNSGNSASDTAKSTTAPSSSVAQGWKIRFQPHLNMMQTGNDPVRMLREISSLGTAEININLDKLPSLMNLEPENCYMSWDVTLQGEIDKKAITEVFEWVEDECDLTVTPLQVEVSKSTMVDSSQVERREGGERRKAVSGSTEAASIRVSIDKVDELINTVGELVITQSMLGQFTNAEEITKLHLQKLRDGLSQLERNTRELQEAVMRIRMLPISHVFQRFPRLVHDISGKLGKKIELKMSGEQTELDKTVMEKIGDPLVHLVRNSIDHGIELPEVRHAAGKRETGMVTLNAYHQGGNIVIEISDDGAGLNKEKIIKKSREKGLIKPEDNPTDEQVFDLIFAPGLSTAEQVSDLSGRGVGMDVVRKNIRALGGTVDVKSQPGKGTTFAIRLPLTLAILDGQLIRVGKEIYIIPLVSIVESLQVKKDRVSVITGRGEVYQLRDEYIPIVRLYKIFGADSENVQLDNGLLVVVEADGKKVAVFVDDLLSQQQVVIKSLESNYKKVDGLSGATILGDGMVALILDITGLVKLSHNQSPVTTLKVVRDGGKAA